VTILFIILNGCYANEFLEVGDHLAK